MAGKRRILAVNVLFFSLGALATTFQCCGFLLSLLMMQSLRQRQLTVQATPLLHDFDTYEQELTVVEVQCGEIRGGQNSGGLTCFIEFFRKESGRRISEWTVQFSCL